MRYKFLIDTYRTEIEKVLTVWSQFGGLNLLRRPKSGDPRGRNLLEHMVHQSLSENIWFVDMLGIKVTENPLPGEETPKGFIKSYAENAGKRLAVLEEKDDAWWEEEVGFFEVLRSRAWIMTRRIAHTAHHRGQQTALLRVQGKELYSTYGPTADTGGLMAAKAPTIYPYPDLETLLQADGDTGRNALPGPGEKPVTERP